MAIGIPAVLAITAAVSAAGAGYSTYEQMQARSAQNKANQQNVAIEQLQSQRNQIMALRQSRIASAQVFAQGAAEGGAGGLLQPSSGVSGATAGFATQTNANIGFARQIDTLTQNRYSYLSKANTDMGNAQLGEGISNTGKQLIGNYNQTGQMIPGLF
jgi:hypothetical protein